MEKIFIFGLCFVLLSQNSRQVSLLRKTTQSQRNNHKNISTLLDNLLRGYDNSIRPGFGGNPAIVEVDVMVRSMGPISEIDMTYSMDCYFRQSWIDKRLAFSGNSKDTLALSISMLARIWKPNTYFYNGKQSYLHTITTPNKFVRLFQNGRVLYSSRLTIKAGCPMNLEDFPMDIQKCPLKFGSFGYTSQDVIYQWNQNRQVAIAEDMKLSQFDLIANPAAYDNSTFVTDNKKADYSMLVISFHLRRHMGNFLIQVYGPCVLLVVLSWVSFWLNREATADRVSLGITTVLTMTFLGLEARTDLPKVPYPTALDCFVFLSFTFIFATIIQFAVVHYFTKYGSGECYFSSDLNSESSSEEENDISQNQIQLSDTKCVNKRASVSGSRKGSVNIAGRPNFLENARRQRSEVVEVITLSVCEIPSSYRKTSRPSWTHLPCVKCPQNEINDKSIFASVSRNDTPSRSNIRENEIETKVMRRKGRRTPRFNSVSKIDRASRVVFPLLFLTINLFYWYSYLSRTKRFQNYKAT